MQGGEFERWEWRPPQLLASLDDGKREQLMGPHVTSHEHFFTVLVAVNIFQVCAPCVVVCVARE